MGSGPQNPRKLYCFQFKKFDDKKLGSLTWFVGGHCFREKESIEFFDFSVFRTDPDKYFKASLFV